MLEFYKCFLSQLPFFIRRIFYSHPILLLLFAFVLYVHYNTKKKKIKILKLLATKTYITRKLKKDAEYKDIIRTLCESRSQEGKKNTKKICIKCVLYA